VKKTANASDTELTSFSKEHLLHELELLMWTASQISSANPPALRSALVESFAIHLRNLIDFFFPHPRQSSRDDDVLAVHFYPGWNETISPALDMAKERANKEISHLTLERKDGLDPTKPWDAVALSEDVHKVAKRFAAGADRKKLHPDVQSFLNMAHNAALVHVDNKPRSNT
jgi:hypothetical protein